MERDRNTTEKRLIHAVGKLIAEDGFEALGVRKVAEKAGVNKTLIYRYFESLDALIYAYMKKHDFWLNTSLDKPETPDIKTYLKAFYRREIAEYRKNIALKRLRRWELSSDKDFIVEIRAQREKNGVQFMEMMAGFVKVDKRLLQAISALMDAGIAHLAMLEENCQMYNGIDIQSDKGWEQITDGIDLLIDTMINV
ncbi:MAG: TetR/AcrR family transcriptional regulator [Tannerella sp.]|nr:TetR/AcrR family transcriptional regulator [Tannerella sp.]